MSIYRCLNDSAHNRFRVVAQAVSRIVYVTDREGKTREDETVKLQSEMLEEVSCAVCGGSVSVTPDV